MAVPRRVEFCVDVRDDGLGVAGVFEVLESGGVALPFDIERPLAVVCLSAINNHLLLSRQALAMMVSIHHDCGKNG